MSPRLPLPSVLLAALVLAGCTTPTSTPPADAVPAKPIPASARPATPPPAPATPADTRPATLKGSQESSTLLDNFTAFVRAVDGDPVAAGRKGWDQALSLTPGKHRIGVEFMRGSFIARTELAFEAKPGAAYELRQTNDAQVYGDHSFCEFWIVELATGHKVAEPKRVALDKVK